MNFTNLVLEEKNINLLEFAFGENVFSLFFCGAIFILATIAFYQFFNKHFEAKRFLSQDSDFLNNIEDFIQESRIDAALDYCTEIDSTTSRIIHSGLTRLGKPVGEIALTLENTKKLEEFSIKKGNRSINYIKQLILFLGFFGASVQMIYYFNSNEATSAKSIYIPMICLSLSLFFSVIFVLLQSKVDKDLNEVNAKIQADINAFLDILNKPI